MWAASQLSHCHWWWFEHILLSPNLLSQGICLISWKGKLCICAHNIMYLMLISPLPTHSNSHVIDHYILCECKSIWVYFALCMFIWWSKFIISWSQLSTPQVRYSHTGILGNTIKYKPQPRSGPRLQEYTTEYKAKLDSALEQLNVPCGPVLP